MLLGLLLPDPCDKHCPAKFKARNGAAGAIEEDARLRALFLCTLQATNGQNGNGEENLDGDEQEPSRRGSEGFSLVFDVVRRFAHTLDIALPTWEGRIIEAKNVVRLLPVSERAKQLFGQDGVGTVVDWIEHDPSKDLQGVLFPELAAEHAPKIHGRGRRRKAIMKPSDMELGAVGIMEPGTVGPEAPRARRLLEEFLEGRGPFQERRPGLKGELKESGS